MVETDHKKRQIAAALTALRIQVQNEASLLRRKLDMKQHLLGEGIDRLKIQVFRRPIFRYRSNYCCSCWWP